MIIGTPVIRKNNVDYKFLQRIHKQYIKILINGTFIKNEMYTTLMKNSSIVKNKYFPKLKIN